MKKTVIVATILIATLFAVTVSTASGTDADGDPDYRILVDLGNGQTYWSEPTGSTVREVLNAACSEYGLTFSDAGGTISVNGKSSFTIGSTTCTWNYYVYSDDWVRTSYSGDAAYSDGYIAIGFYPEDLIPTVTPEYKNAWTVIKHDAFNSGAAYNYDAPSDKAQLHYEYYNSTTLPACYASSLYANGQLVVHAQDYFGKGKNTIHMAAIDLETGTTLWDIVHPKQLYDMSTAAIYGGSAYFTSACGNVYQVPMVGENKGTITHTVEGLPISGTFDRTGSIVMPGLSCIVYDSGHLFFGSSGGKVYCMTPSLDIVWEYQMDGAVYPSLSITVGNGLVYVGGCDGRLYILDESNGTLKTRNNVYYDDAKGGRLGTPAVIGDTIFVSYNDGQGMDTSYWGMSIWKYNSATAALTPVKNMPDLPIQSNYQVISPTNDRIYALGINDKDPTLFSIYLSGWYEALFTVPEIHGGLTFINNSHFYAVDYYSKGSLRCYDLTGNLVCEFKKTSNVENYSMGGVFVAGEYIGAVSDSGTMVLKGSMLDGKIEPVPPGPGPDPPGPEPSASNVKFLIVDNEGFYITIEGRGVSVIQAFDDAINKYDYQDYVEYAGSPGSYTGVNSMFGMGFEQVSPYLFRFWKLFEWDEGTDYWITTSSVMGNLNAEDNPGVLLCYGESADGMDMDVPTGLPTLSELHPLEISDEGTRFLIESQTGEFFVINGSGTNLELALKSACDTNHIPYTIVDGSFRFFGIDDTSETAWNGYTADGNSWSYSTKKLSEYSNAAVFGLYYGAPTSLPDIPISNIIDLGIDGAGEDYLGYAILIIAAGLFAAFLIYLAHKAKINNMSLGWAFKEMINKSSSNSKVKQNKWRLLIVCLIGLVATFLMFLCCLAIGPSVNLPLPETFSALISAIGKNGQDLTFEEIVVYQSRLPRAIAALAVGIGLSIAGCVYQAIIRNPLVDPYIMGVSSGAGTMAVAAIIGNFTFFGLLANGAYSTPILAILGGLFAFALTLIIAEKAGGSSTNYVLAGVVIGLVFSAIQTVLLVTSKSDKIASAISWLFGSFANVGWDTVWIIFFPAITLSLVPLVWAKELNLVLLGEDQAKQMGLDVRKFNRWMLILASVLTSVCVAFVGIIGFVGMVIPHLCRMILGGDHRLVLPASIMIGGALMLFADLMAKMLMIPAELPVGAITTIIGVPVFAYLLIKKGRMYSG